jgi:hypothetical protein
VLKEVALVWFPLDSITRRMIDAAAAVAGFALSPHFRVAKAARLGMVGADAWED